jgi:hypothetical protein
MSSDFLLFSGSGYHESTTWSIKDTNNNCVWERKFDKDNLYSIVVPEDILKNNTSYVIYVQYHSTTNTSSNYGKLTISTGNVNDLLIDIRNSEITATINRCYLDLKVNTDQYESVLITIKDASGNIVGERAHKTIYTVNCTAPIMLGERYTVYIKIKYNNNTFSNTTELKLYAVKPAVTMCDTSKINDDKIEYLMDSNITNDIHLTEELPNGMIPIFKDSATTMSLYRYNGTNRLIEISLTNISLPGSTKHSIKLLPNNKLLIIYKKSGNYRFTVYDYNPLVNTFTKLVENNVTGLIKDINDTNAVTVVSSNEVVYLQGNVLSKYNVDSNTITDLTTISLSENNINIIGICNNELLIMLGSSGTKVTNTKIYKYNILENTMSHVDTIPSNIDTKVFKRQSHLRKDGKIVFFNLSNSQKKNQNIIIYDHKLKNWEVTPETINFTEMLTGTIILNNGSIIRHKTKTIKYT